MVFQQAPWIDAKASGAACRGIILLRAAIVPIAAAHALCSERLSGGF
jgi:hypothetical protein